MTKHHTLRYAAALIAAIVGLAAAQTRAERPIMPDSLDGSMMVYDFRDTDRSADIPDSLEAVHVAYVARHGARYLSSEKKVSKMREILLKQVDDGTLTDEGASFLATLDVVNDLSKNKWGDLSEVGVQEEVRLGAEMAALFPDLMKRGEVKAKSTYVPRVVMTMYQFLHSLGKRDQGLDISTLAGHANDSLLRCFDAFRDYSEYRDEGMWKEVCDAFIIRHVSPEPALKVFGTSDAVVKEALSLTMDMYGVLQGMRAIGLDGPTDEYMTEEEYRACWEASNLKRYLRNTLNPLSTACAGATSVLIEDIIRDCDRWENHPLTAWFGHAETLMPMLSVMDVPGCAYFSDDWDSVAAHWRSQDVVPLGANFMLILMRPKGNPSGPLYAAVRLNGRNTPPYPGASRIIPWRDLKSRWLARLVPRSGTRW